MLLENDRSGQCGFKTVRAVMPDDAAKGPLGRAVWRRLRVVRQRIEKTLNVDRGSQPADD